MPWEQRLDQFAHQHRNILAPPLVGSLVFGLGALANTLGGWGWVSGLVALVVVIVGVDNARKLPSRVERRISVPAWLLGGVWVGASAFMPPWSAPMLAGFLAGLLPLWVLWAHHRRVRRGVEVDRAIAPWGDGSAIGLKGTKVRGTKAGSDWFSFKVTADEPGRYVLDDYRKRRKRIAARFGVRSEAVSFRELDAEGDVEVTIREGTRETITYETSTEAVPIAGSHRVGTLDDGEPLLVAMYLTGGDGGRAGAQHAGITGDTGTGKSSMINRGGAVVARAPEALLWMIDLSLGAQELKAWAPVCDWFATTADEADRMIAAATAVAEDRGRRAKSRLFVPTPQEPLIVILADEMASIFAPDLLPDAEYQDLREAKKRARARAGRFEEGIRNWRKHGVAFWGATQYGNAEALGTPTAKQQLVTGHAVVFYAAKPQTGYLVIPQSHGAKSSELPSNKPGTAFVRSAAMDGVRKGRIEYMDDDEIADTVATWAPRQPSLEPRAVAAAGAAYSHRQRTAPGQTGEAPRHRPRVVAEETPRRMPSAEESRQLVFDALTEFPEGAGPKQIAETCGKSPETVKVRLGELAAEDPPRAQRVRLGKWTVVTASDGGNNATAGR